MPKLNFKRTPEKEAEVLARKASRKEKKRKRTASDHTSSSKRYHNESDGNTRRKWASGDEDDMPSTRRSSKAGQPYDTGQTPDYEAMRAEVEEMFRDKLFGALGEDERLDGVESHFNDFAHVPDRWKAAAAGGSEKFLYEEDDFLKVNPSTLDDEEYAEWIRLGMYRKSHAAEHAEHLRRKAAAAEGRTAEKVRRAEAKRLEKLAEEERRQKKRERDGAKRVQAKADYHAEWKILLHEANNSDASERQLEYEGIPWPIYPVSSRPAEGHFTKEAISSFLLAGKDEDKTTRKDILRETFLRFHPDKFEGRFMRRVKEDDRESVRLAIGQISRVLNHLLDET